MRFTEKQGMGPGRGGHTECVCTFHCSAEQKIITDGAPSSRDFPVAAIGWGGMSLCKGEAGNGVGTWGLKVK